MGVVLPAECGPVITHQAVWMCAEGVSPAMSIVQGGGRIERESGLGRKRTDLQVRWPYGAGQLQTIVLELKLVQKGRGKPSPRGWSRLGPTPSPALPSRRAW